MHRIQRKFSSLGSKKIVSKLTCELKQALSVFFNPAVVLAQLGTALLRGRSRATGNALCRLAQRS